jgi:CRP-like cAMP-binding protein
MVTKPTELPGLVAALARRRALARGDVVFRAGAAARHVFFLLSGRVVLQRFGRGGEEVVIHVAHPGEFFAEASLHGERYHCTATAAAPGELAAIDATALRERLRTDAEFAMQWLAIVSRQLRAARARVERLALRSAAERVRHLLFTEGRGDPPGYALRGTTRELAAELGLTHEALYRTLAAMERDGTIERAPGWLRLVRSPAPG